MLKMLIFLLNFCFLSITVIIFLFFFFAVRNIAPTEATADKISSEEEIWLWNHRFGAANSVSSSVENLTPTKHSNHPNSSDEERSNHFLNQSDIPNFFNHTTVAAPKLHHRPKPKEIQQIPKFDASVRGEALEGSERYAPLNEERVDHPLSRLSGEEGETIAANHFQNFGALTDSEVERFLQAHSHRESLQSREETFEDTSLSVDAPQKSIITQTTPLSTITASEDNVTPNHAANLKNLFRELVRQVGLTVSDSSNSNYNMDVNIKLHKALRRSKRIVNNRYLYDTEIANELPNDNEPKITLNLQITL